MAAKCRLGRVERISTWGMKRIVGRVVLSDCEVVGSRGVVVSWDMSRVLDCRLVVPGMVGVGPPPTAVEARVRVILELFVGGSGAADSVEVEVKLFLPCTVGSQPFSPFCIPEEVFSSAALAVVVAMVGKLAPTGELVLRVSGGASDREYGWELECECKCSRVTLRK